MNKLNYKILEGRRCIINDSIINVNKVEEKKDPDGTAVYTINDGQTFPRFDIALAVTLTKNQITEENLKKDLLSRLKRKFGLFFRVSRLMLDAAPPEIKDVLYQSTMGLRNYGFKKCGIFLNFRFGSIAIDIEFCWKNKDIYEKGDLPNPFIDYKKVF